MTRAAVCTYLGALAAGLLMGSVFAFKVCLSQLRQYEIAQAWTAPHVLSDFSTLQFRYADSGHAAEALKMYASYLEENEKFVPDRTNRTALSLVYVRLALLEDASNNRTRSAELMKKAQILYRASGGRIESDTELKDAIRKLDERIWQ
jgi:hypothetical protein